VEISARKTKGVVEEKPPGKQSKMEKSAKRPSGAKRQLSRSAVSAKKKSTTNQLSKRKPR
jgi:hypothetical protein